MVGYHALLMLLCQGQAYLCTCTYTWSMKSLHMWCQPAAGMCCRFGAKTVWIIRICMAVLAPVAWPLAFILDKVQPFACPRNCCVPCQHLQCSDSLP